jgi:hypothetical protein
MSKLATRILDEIQKEMKIDEQWMSSNSNSLTWVAHKLEQTFSVSEPFTFLGKEAVSLESRIPVALHVKRPKEQVCGLLCQFNYTIIGSAYVFDADREEVFSSLKIVVTEADLAERCWQIRTFALFQMIMVEHQAQFILDAISGDLAKAGSTREQPDAMLESFMDFVTSRPRSENRFENQEEFKLAAEYCEKIGGVSSDSDHPGATLEFRFSDFSTATASLITDNEHPSVGRGLRTLLALPISYKSNEQASLAANDLNLREVADNENGDFLGAWSIDQRNKNLSPVFTAYMPNALFSKSLAAKSAVQLGMRARICERWRFPETKFSKTALEIVMGRKGQLFEGEDRFH